jgi:hypothetical protein
MRCHTLYYLDVIRGAKHEKENSIGLWFDYNSGAVIG